MSRSSHLIGVNLLNESLESGHEAWGEMAVLEENPFTSLHGTLHHSFSTRTLEAKQKDISDVREVRFIFTTISLQREATVTHRTQIYYHIPSNDVSPIFLRRSPIDRNI